MTERVWVPYVPFQCGLTPSPIRGRRFNLTKDEDTMGEERGFTLQVSADAEGWDVIDDAASECLATFYDEDRARQYIAMLRGKAPRGKVWSTDYIKAVRQALACNMIYAVNDAVNSDERAWQDWAIALGKREGLEVRIDNRGKIEKLVVDTNWPVVGQG